MLFDSHVHLCHRAFTPSERVAALERARAVGVTELLDIACDSRSLEASRQLAVDGVHVLRAAATPPHGVEEGEDPFFREVEEAAYKGELAAIGEVGLEFFHGREQSTAQKASFVRYATLAQEAGLPLVIHCRNACADLIDLLLPFRVRGVIHCFTGSYEEARALLDLGLLLSFSGIVTFPNAKALRALLPYVPLDRMLLETDTPYLAPQSRRGARNEPANLPEILSVVASQLHVDEGIVASATRDNALSLFVRGSSSPS